METEKITCTFRVDKNMLPELWDAETGLIQRKLEFSKAENGICIDFVMDPLSSKFVVFRNKSTGKNDSGLSYDLQFGFHSDKGAEKISGTIDISKDWLIIFNPDMGAPESFHMDSLSSWSDIGNEGIKYYSGSANYEKEFSIDEKKLIDGIEAFAVFDDIQEMAHVIVNGNDCGVVWIPPYKVNITKYLKEGLNKITVQVVNTWNNRIVGDVRNPNKKSYATTNGKAKFNKNSPLLKSGLIGKAEIVFINKTITSQ